MGLFSKRAPKTPAPPPTKQVLRLTNESKKTLEIMVEILPERHLLRSNQEIQIEADATPHDEVFTLTMYDGGLQIYAGWDASPVVRIDGKLSEPDWDTPHPDDDKSGDATVG